MELVIAIAVYFVIAGYTLGRLVEIAIQIEGTLTVGSFFTALGLSVVWPILMGWYFLGGNK